MEDIPPQLDETACHGLVEGIAGVVGGEVEVVQRGLGAATVDDCLATVEDHADVAGNVLLRVFDEGVQGALERGEPLSVVDQLCPALANSCLEAGLFALDGDVLEVLVRGDQRHGTRGGFIDFAGLDADEAIFNDVDAANALGACTAVQLLDGLQRGDLYAVDRYRNTGLEGDGDLIGRGGNSGVAV